MTVSLRSLKYLLCVLLLIALSAAEAQTIRSASCSSADVQNALNSVSANGTTVIIPAGNCAWTSTVAWTQPSAISVTIQGATTCGWQSGGDPPAGTVPTSNIVCTDSTVLIHSLSTDAPMLQINAASNASLTIQGITFQKNAATAITYEGPFRIYGPSAGFRMTQVHFYNIGADTHSNSARFQNIYGVVDHSRIDMLTSRGGQTGQMRVGGPNPGHTTFADESYFGSDKFLFFENNTFAYGFSNDCQYGGKYVMRYNTFIEAVHQGHGVMQAERGCRAYESYKNKMTSSSVAFPTWAAILQRAGTGLVWGNVISGYGVLLQIYDDRSDGQHTQQAVPNGYGNCGKYWCGTYPCTTSAWDQNLDTETGYACFSQPGRGKGDLLSGLFPPYGGGVINTTTGTVTWPHSKLEPVYVWGNTWNPPYSSAQVQIGGGLSWHEIVRNRDWYDDDGSTGVTSQAAQPATCSPNTTEYPTGNRPGQGFWNTNTQTLYRCTATNTWTAYYTPFTYPHPLTGSAGPGTPPPPPINLSAVVK